MIDKQKIIIISAAALIFVCISLIIISVTNGSSEVIVEQTYTLEFPLMLPEEPGYSGEYLYVNTPRDRWKKEDVDEWFVILAGNNLEKLSAANDQLVVKILEAAP